MNAFAIIIVTLSILGGGARLAMEGIYGPSYDPSHSWPLGIMPHYAESLMIVGIGVSLGFALWHWGQIGEHRRKAGKPLSHGRIAAIAAIVDFEVPREINYKKLWILMWLLAFIGVCVLFAMYYAAAGL